jgi:cytochrome P450
MDFRFAGRTVVVADLAEAEPLLKGDPKLSHAGEARRGVLPQASAGSSFGADGDSHRELRARLVVALDRERLEAQRDVVHSVGRRHADMWPTGRPIRVLSRMRSIAEEVFIRVALGITDEQRVRSLRDAVGAVLRVPGIPLTPPDRDHPLGMAIDGVLRRRLRPVAAILEAELALRRNGGGDEGTSILDVLAADSSIDAARATDELLVVLAAAQEPTSIALTWVTMELSRREDLRREFIESQPQSAHRLAVTDEILRLYPPALASLRTLAEDRTIGGHPLPAGTVTMVPIPLLHRDRDSFPDPLRLDPDRFLGEERPDHFMPFGAGRRRCPGEDLARLEIDVIVPTVLKMVDLEFPGRHERPVQRATVLVPNRSGLALARNRA